METTTVSIFCTKESDSANLDKLKTFLTSKKKKEYILPLRSIDLKRPQYGTEDQFEMVCNYSPYQISLASILRENKENNVRFSFYAFLKVAVTLVRLLRYLKGEGIRFRELNLESIVQTENSKLFSQFKILNLVFPFSAQYLEKLYSKNKLSRAPQNFFAQLSHYFHETSDDSSDEFRIGHILLQIIMGEIIHEKDLKIHKEEYIKEMRETLITNLADYEREVINVVEDLLNEFVLSNKKISQHLKYFKHPLAVKKKIAKKEFHSEYVPIEQKNLFGVDFDKLARNIFY